MYQNCLTFHLDPIGSDHCPVLINTCFKEKLTPRTFKFEILWVDHPDFLEVVKEGWENGGWVSNGAMDEYVKMLNNCRRILIVWSKRVFQNNAKVLEQLAQELRVCLEGDFSEEKAIEAVQVTKKIEEAWDMEENIGLIVQG